MFKIIKQLRLEGASGSVFKIIPIAPSGIEMAGEKNINIRPAPTASRGFSAVMQRESQR